MRRSKRCWRNAGHSLALALLAAACLPSVQTGDDSLLPSNDASPPPNTRPPTAAASTSPSGPAPSRSSDDPGTLEFRVSDTEGRARPGVPVHYRGPAAGTAVTGENGRARVAVPAGSYHVQIPVGCVRQLEIFRGSQADVGVYPGGRSVVRLTGIEARAGIWLANPMTWDRDPPWAIGDRVRATVTVIDRCRQRPAAAGTSVGWLRWRASPPIEIVGATPARADDEQTITIAFRCVAAGTAGLDFIDPVTGEHEDLLRIKRTFDVVEPTCA